MPLAIDVPRDPEKALTLTTPLHCVEVQLGALVARDQDARVLAEGKAGERIDGDPLRVPVTLTATESPCCVRLVYESEGRAYEARQRSG